MAENLPPGVHCQPTSLFQSNQGSFVLWADENASPFDGPIKLVATGKRGDETLVREVRPYTRIWQDNNPGSSRPSRAPVISVRETGPFQPGVRERKLTIEAGQKAEVKTQLKRLWPEFTNQVNLQAVAFPGPIKANLVQIAAGANEATVTFEANSGAPPGEYTVTILGQAQVPFAKEGGKDKQNTLITIPEPAPTITVLPKAVKQP